MVTREHRNDISLLETKRKLNSHKEANTTKEEEGQNYTIITKIHSKGLRRYTIYMSTQQQARKRRQRYHFVRFYRVWARRLTVRVRVTVATIPQNNSFFFALF